MQRSDIWTQKWCLYCEYHIGFFINMSDPQLNGADMKQNVWYWNNYSVYQETFADLPKLITDWNGDLSLPVAPEISLEVKKGEFTVWVLWALCLYSAAFVRTLNSPYLFVPLTDLGHIFHSQRYWRQRNRIQLRMNLSWLYIYAFVNRCEKVSLYARRSEIRGVDIDNPYLNVIMALTVPDIDDVSTMDYDAVDERIYWADVKTRTIKRVFINGTKLETVLSGGTASSIWQL